MSRTNSESIERKPVDVLVLGGGITGVSAALVSLSAKERDASVLIVEPHNVLGGLGTAGGVAGFCGDTTRASSPSADLVSILEKHKLIAPMIRTRIDGNTT